VNFSMKAPDCSIVIDGMDDCYTRHLRLGQANNLMLVEENKALATKNTERHKKAFASIFVFFVVI
jgi:hypothetical protein